MLLSLRTNQTRQGAEEEKAFVPCSPHRIPSDAAKISDTWDIAVSAKQRNSNRREEVDKIAVGITKINGMGTPWLSGRPFDPVLHKTV